MPMLSPEGRELERQHRAKALAPELATALRKVTGNLRTAVTWADNEVQPSYTQIEEFKAGVLEAEALLKRIDEGTT